MFSPAQPALASESAWVLPAGSRYFEWQMGYGRFTQDNLQHEQLIFQNRYEHGLLENTSVELAWPMLLRARPNPSTAASERPQLVNKWFHRYLYWTQNAVFSGDITRKFGFKLTAQC